MAGSHDIIRAAECPVGPLPQVPKAVQNLRCSTSLDSSRCCTVNQQRVSLFGLVTACCASRAYDDPKCANPSRYPHQGVSKEDLPSRVRGRSMMLVAGGARVERRTLLIDMRRASLGRPGPVQGRGQGTPATRISSSRQLQMVRQARQREQVGSPRVSRPGRQADGIRLFPPAAVPQHPAHHM